jgi:hypothetical protein
VAGQKSQVLVSDNSLLQTPKKEESDSEHLWLYKTSKAVKIPTIP